MGILLTVAKKCATMVFNANCDLKATTLQNFTNSGMETTQFQCPFCGTWIPKQEFDRHMLLHPEPVIIAGRVVDKPMTLEEMKRRFAPLGYYVER